MPVYTGGRTLYGHALGVLMLDTHFPRPPGDIGNATTWPFPVRYRIISGAHPFRVIGELDPTLRQPFLDAARELADEGVQVITTSCGFLATIQPDLAAAVPVPVVSSSLLQVPLAARMIGADRRVAILTPMNELTEHHFSGVGWSPRDIPIVVKPFPPEALFTTVYARDTPEVHKPEVDTDLLEREVVGQIAQLLTEAPDVGAIVMECTNLVPYSQAVRRAFGLPVFDIYTAVMLAYGATMGRDFS